MISSYDQASDFYYNFVQSGLSEPQSIFNLSASAIVNLLGDVDGKLICDVACGEGHFSRKLAQNGAVVTAVDISENLLAHAHRQARQLARQLAGRMAITLVRDDAQTLGLLPAETFQMAVCNMALMDIPDYAQVCRAVHRVLTANGKFVISVLHPCFETPFSVPESQLQLDEQGHFVAFVVRRYAAEGYWKSGGTGMRGTFGAHHRTLSTYLNGLIEAGFRIERVVEPRLPPGEYTSLSDQINSRVGQLLVVAAEKIS